MRGTSLTLLATLADLRRVVLAPLSKFIPEAKSQWQELQGRVVGRNNDDACILLNGLEILSREWSDMEAELQLTQSKMQASAIYIHCPNYHFNPSTHCQQPKEFCEYTNSTISQMLNLEYNIPDLSKSHYTAQIPHCCLRIILFCIASVARIVDQ